MSFAIFGADSLVVPVVSEGGSAAARTVRRCSGPQSRCGGAGGRGLFAGDGGSSLCAGCALLVRQGGGG